MYSNTYFFIISIIYCQNWYNQKRKAPFKNVFIYNFAGYTQQTVGLSGGDSDRGVIENYEKNLSNSPQVDFTASLAVSSPARYPHFLIEWIFCSAEYQ